jgi:hypothetical protein
VCGDALVLDPCSYRQGRTKDDFLSFIKEKLQADTG